MAIDLSNPDRTYLHFRQDRHFQPFFKGYLDLLEEKLEVVEIRNPEGTYRYYSCGEPHSDRNERWEPFKWLKWYCKKTGYDYYVALDMIKERIGSKVICECHIVSDPRDVRRAKLKQLGVDFGEPGRRDLDVL